MSDPQPPSLEATEPGPVLQLLPDDPEPEHTAPPSRRQLIVLAALLFVALAGTAAIGSAGWRVISQRKATLTAPEQVAGLIRDDSRPAQATAGHLRDVVAANLELDQSVGVAYGDPTDSNRKVLLFGGTTLLWAPERELDSLIELIGEDAGTIVDSRQVHVGDLGGVMKCVTADSAEGDMTLCGWADHGSIVLALFPGHDADEAAVLLRDIRAAVQSRP